MGQASLLSVNKKKKKKKKKKRWLRRRSRSSYSAHHMRAQLKHTVVLDYSTIMWLNVA
jgi:hypothetical protein